MQVKHKSRDQLEDEIKELKNKTCDNCIHKPKPNENYSFTCGDCSRFYSDGFEEVAK